MDERIASYIEQARKASDAEILINIEVNSGQPEIRGAYMAERERRLNSRNDKVLADQLRLARTSAVTAICAAFVATIAAAATVVQAVVAYLGAS